MRIAFSGSSGVGKTTLIKEFITNFNMYKLLAKSYRDDFTDDELKELKETKKTNNDIQKKILNNMIEQLKKYKDEKYIVYDRCPLDVLAYTTIAYENEWVDDECYAEIIKQVHDSLHLLDIIFVLPYKDYGTEKGKNAEINKKYNIAVDGIFKGILHQYYTNIDSDIFFPATDCPGIIELEPNNKLLQIKTILNKDGDLYSLEEEREAQSLVFEQFMNKGQTKKEKAKNAMNNLIIANEELLAKDMEDKLKDKSFEFNN